MAYARSRADVDPGRVVILGQSLGAANAIAVAGDGRCPGVRAVVADSPFSSYRRIVRDKIGEMPLLSFLKWPLSCLVIRDAHSPEACVARVAPTPLLVIHGTRDMVVPYHHGRRLYELAGEPA